MVDKLSIKSKKIIKIWVLFISVVLTNCQNEIPEPFALTTLRSRAKFNLTHVNKRGKVPLSEILEYTRGRDVRKVEDLIVLLREFVKKPRTDREKEIFIRTVGQKFYDDSLGIQFTGVDLDMSPSLTNQLEELERYLAAKRDYYNRSQDEVRHLGSSEGNLDRYYEALSVYVNEVITDIQRQITFDSDNESEFLVNSGNDQGEEFISRHLDYLENLAVYFDGSENSLTLQVFKEPVDSRFDFPYYLTLFAMKSYIYLDTIYNKLSLKKYLATATQEKEPSKDDNSDKSAKEVEKPADLASQPNQSGQTDSDQVDDTAIWVLYDVEGIDQVLARIKHVQSRFLVLARNIEIAYQNDYRTYFYDRRVVYSPSMGVAGKADSYTEISASYQAKMEKLDHDSFPTIQVGDQESGVTVPETRFDRKEEIKSINVSTDGKILLTGIERVWDGDESAGVVDLFYQNPAGSGKDAWKPLLRVMLPSGVVLEEAFIQKQYLKKPEKENDFETHFPTSEECEEYDIDSYDVDIESLNDLKQQVCWIMDKSSVNLDAYHLFIQGNWVKDAGRRDEGGSHPLCKEVFPYTRNPLIGIEKIKTGVRKRRGGITEDKYEYNLWATNVGIDYDKDTYLLYVVGYESLINKTDYKVFTYRIQLDKGLDINSRFSAGDFMDCSWQGLSSQTNVNSALSAITIKNDVISAITSWQYIYGIYSGYQMAVSVSELQFPGIEYHLKKKRWGKQPPVKNPKDLYRRKFSERSFEQVMQISGDPFLGHKSGLTMFTTNNQGNWTLKHFALDPVSLNRVGKSILINSGKTLFYDGEPDIERVAFDYHNPPFKMAIMSPVDRESDLELEQDIVLIQVYYAIDIYSGDKYLSTMQYMLYVPVDRELFRDIGFKTKEVNVDMQFLHKGSRTYLVLLAKKDEIEDPQDIVEDENTVPAVKGGKDGNKDGNETDATEGDVAAADTEGENLAPVEAGVILANKFTKDEAGAEDQDTTEGKPEAVQEGGETTVDDGGDEGVVDNGSEGAVDGGKDDAVDGEENVVEEPAEVPRKRIKKQPRKELVILDITLPFEKYVQAFKQDAFYHVDEKLTIYLKGTEGVEKEPLARLQYKDGRINICKVTGDCKESISDEAQVKSVEKFVQKRIKKVRSCLIRRNYFRFNYATEEEAITESEGFCMDGDKGAEIPESPFGYKQVVATRVDPSFHFAITEDTVAIASTLPKGVTRPNGEVVSIAELSLYQFDDLKRMGDIMNPTIKRSDFDLGSINVYKTPDSEALAGATSKLVAHPYRREFILGLRNGNIYILNTNKANQMTSRFTSMTLVKMRLLASGEDDGIVTTDIFDGSFDLTANQSENRPFRQITLKLVPNFKQFFPKPAKLLKSNEVGLKDVDRIFVDYFDNVLRARMKGYLEGSAIPTITQDNQEDQTQATQSDDDLANSSIKLTMLPRFVTPSGGAKGEGGKGVKKTLVSFHLGGSTFDHSNAKHVPGPVKNSPRGNVAVVNIKWEYGIEDDARDGATGADGAKDDTKTKGNLYLYFNYQTRSYYYLMDQIAPSVTPVDDYMQRQPGQLYFPLIRRPQF